MEGSLGLLESSILKVMGQFSCSTQNKTRIITDTIRSILIVMFSEIIGTITTIVTITSTMIAITGSIITVIKRKIQNNNK
jgi:hypothetical protein